VLPARRASFLRPISSELLEIGPEVCDVLVVLDADKCHARARHFLHRRADIFGESFLAPGDAGRFIGWGVVVTLEGAALADIDAIGRWGKLDFGVLPNLVAGGAQSLEHLLAGSGVLPGPVEAATAIPAITHVLSISLLFERDRLSASGMQRSASRLRL